MANLHHETVLSVRHWNDTLFSFTTTRDRGLRFRSGHFAMIGLEVEGRPLMRAFSFANAHYDDCLEFYSIKVPDGPLTSRLQHVRPGDQILVSKKPTGTLVLGTLTPAKRLYLLATGTGLAPFLSIVRDPETYARYEQVVLVHGVRQRSELGYSDYLQNELPNHELLGQEVRQQLLYYPTVTREPFRNQGRITDLLASGRLPSDLGLPALNRDEDRVMICGSPEMLRDTTALLEDRGFAAGRTHAPGDYTFERAFTSRD